MRVLGIDTSNYTCSAALFDSDSGEVYQVKNPLPVSEGKVGLRQSQAVFEHVKRTGETVKELFEKVAPSFHSIGVSVKPRNQENSYMPCFLVGKMAAQCMASASGTPLYTFSHQQGHIASALLGAGRTSLLEEGQPFFAFHLSGGTTDMLLVTPSENEILKIEEIGTSLDLKAGQAIDRIGVKMGLSFPAGKQMEDLALQIQEEEFLRQFAGMRISAPVKDGNCSLSGLENLCERWMNEKKSFEAIARYVFFYLQSAVEHMLQYAVCRYGKHPVVFSGGVMSNRLLRDFFLRQYQGIFAPPAFSSDNAAGVAFLGFLKEKSNAKI